ncbi:MAG: NAD-dependent epimerase/dehydratase family protein [Balneolaceae bacterium]
MTKVTYDPQFFELTSNQDPLKILITGAAGFIGYHLAKKLIDENVEIVGLDNLNEYYNLNLKYARLEELGIDKSGLASLNGLAKSNTFDNFSFIQCDLCDKNTIAALFEEQGFDVVINMAAQAGIRYSIVHPHSYISSNLEGFLNILEGCRHFPVKHLIYASSSSVYGLNKKMPFEISDKTDSPASLYAATKKANELMAHTYSHLYNIPSTGLRFFTVYGPFGRPDMAYFKFANLINNGQPIDVYNNGEMARDFTYIDDITESILRLIPLPPNPDSFNGSDGSPSDPETPSNIPYQLFNIGNGAPVNLLKFIEILESHLGKKADKNMLPMQPGDVKKTWADVSNLYSYINYKPTVGIDEGLKYFSDWYKLYFGVH